MPPYGPKCVPTGYGPRDINHAVSDTISKKTRGKLPPPSTLFVKKTSGCQQNVLILLPREALRRQLRNLENITLVSRRREHFRFSLVIFLGSQLPPQRGVLVHKNSLASCQRCHSVEPRALTCPFKQSNLSAWSRQNL